MVRKKVSITEAIKNGLKHKGNQKREKIQCRTKEGHKPKLRDCFCLKDYVYYSIQRIGL